MNTTVSGTLHGDTIKLDRPIDMLSGQKVEVVIRPTKDLEHWGEGLKRCAGSLADMPELDAIMDEIYQQRKLERRIQAT
jgi:hypothetical protein